MRTPTTPISALPPSSFSGSFIPLTFDIHIPFLLLGSRSLASEIAKGEERHTKRLNVLARGLEAQGMGVKIWQENVTEDEYWRGVETEKWIIRCVRGEAGNEEAGAAPVSMPRLWRYGDGEATAREAREAKKKNVWTIGVLLSRYDLSAAFSAGESSDRELDDRWKAEIHTMMTSLAKFDGGSDSGGLLVVAGERCYPSVSFHLQPDAGDEEAPTTTTWDDIMTKNVLVQLAAFEREMSVPAGPEFFSLYKPLSDFMLGREISKLRKEKRRLWRTLRRDVCNNTYDNNENKQEESVSHDREELDREELDLRIREWQGELERADDAGARLDALLGGEGTPWADRIYDELHGPESGSLIRDIAARTAGHKGRRLAIGLGLFDSTPPPASTPRIPLPKPSTSKSTSINANANANDISLLLPQISSLSFVIPTRTVPLASAPLLAHTTLLVSLLRFAASTTSPQVRKYVGKVRVEARRAGDSAVDAYRQLLVEIGEMEEVGVEEAMEASMVVGGAVGGAAGGGDLGDSRNEVVDVGVAVGGRWREGRRYVGGGSVGVVESGRGKERGAEGEDEVRDDGNGEGGGGEGERAGGTEYLGRYEIAGGFLVPGRKRVLELLEGMDEVVG